MRVYVFQHLSKTMLRHVWHKNHTKTPAQQSCEPTRLARLQCLSFLEATKRRTEKRDLKDETKTRGFDFKRSIEPKHSDIEKFSDYCV